MLVVLPYFKMLVRWAFYSLVAVAILGSVTVASAEGRRSKHLIARAIQPEKWTEADRRSAIPSVLPDGEKAVVLRGTTDDGPNMLFLLDLKTGELVPGKEWSMPREAQWHLSLDGSSVWYTHNQDWA